RARLTRPAPRAGARGADLSRGAGCPQPDRAAPPRHGRSGYGRPCDGSRRGPAPRGGAHRMAEAGGVDRPLGRLHPPLLGARPLAAAARRRGGLRPRPRRPVRGDAPHRARTRLPPMAPRQPPVSPPPPSPTKPLPVVTAASSPGPLLFPARGRTLRATVRIPNGL